MDCNFFKCGLKTMKNLQIFLYSNSTSLLIKFGFFGSYLLLTAWWHFYFSFFLKLSIF